jgi:hypothetical protein
VTNVDGDPVDGEPVDGEPGTPQPWLPPSEFERIYGPQLSWTPEEARDLLEGLPVPWWVAGGWAIEAFTGVAREHEDIDLSILRRDLPAVRHHLEGGWHLWARSDRGLTHLAPGREMPEHAEQVWVREHALAPWRGEFVLNPDVDGRWRFKRDPSVVTAIEEATWQRDGIRYLRPELVLAHKVATTRPKDDADLTAALPLLGVSEQAWLADFVARHAPAHPWLERLRRARLS